MKNNNYTTRFDINEIFPMDWYENVTNAANYVLSNVNIPKEKRDDIVLRIIDYNINKQIQDKVINAAIDDLPTYLSFVDISSAKVFNEFKTILDICSMSSSFKEHVMYFQVYDIDYDKRRLNFWKKLVKKDYPELHISTRELKSQDCIKLVIRKK